MYIEWKDNKTHQLTKNLFASSTTNKNISNIA